MAELHPVTIEFSIDPAGASSRAAGDSSKAGNSSRSGGQWMEYKKIERKVSGQVCLFGVSCNYGTDDPFFLSIFAVALRATWLAYGIFLGYYYFVQPGCTDVQLPRILTVTLMGMLLSHFLVLITFLTCIIISSLGSLINPKPRQKIVVVLHVLLALFVVELAWLGFATYAATTESIKPATSCPAYQRVVVMYYVAIGTSWFVNLLLLFLFLGGLDPCGCCTVTGLLNGIDNIKKYEKENEKLIDLGESLDDFRKYNSIPGLYTNSINSAKIRSNYCRICCKRRDGLETSTLLAMKDVVRVVGVLFQDFDATFSDLVTGFLLTGHYQKHLYDLKKSPEAELTKATVELLKENGSVSSDYVTPPPIPLTRQEVDELSSKCCYYFKYAMATYGGFNSISDQPCRSFLTICEAASGCIFCPKCRSQRYEGDTEAIPYSVIISASVGLPQEYIVTASFVNSVFRVPYFVTYNPVNKELVVAIRGSLSFQDVLTDVSAALVKVPGGLLGLEDAFVHRGFFEAAVVIYKSLMAHSRFKGILGQNNIDKFVITGHSLGGAVGSILTILFKDHHKDAPWINTIEGLFFSTPGATMSYSLAERTKGFMVSVVGPNDFASRLTLRSLGYLKQMVETMLVTVDSSKQRVLCCVGGASCQCCPPQVSEDEDLVGISHIEQVDPENSNSESLRCYLPFTITNPLWKQGNRRVFVDDFIRRLDMRMAGAKEDPDQPMMFLPGRVLHLEEPDQYAVNECCGMGETARVTGSWKARESLSTILVHPDMLLDHSTNRCFSLYNNFTCDLDSVMAQDPHPISNDRPVMSHEPRQSSHDHQVYPNVQEPTSSSTQATLHVPSLYPQLY